MSSIGYNKGKKRMPSITQKVKLLTSVKIISTSYIITITTLFSVLNFSSLVYFDHLSLKFVESVSKNKKINLFCTK